MKSFTGLNGKVFASEDTVMIKREGKLDKVFHESDLTIPLNQIYAVEYMEGGITNGFIAFLRKGDKIPHSVFAALKNENAIIFRFNKNLQAKKFAEHVECLCKEM